MKSVFHFESAELPLPPHFTPERVGEVWQVPYAQTAQLASQWQIEQQIPPSGNDRYRVNLLLIDLQNTFCIPGFELFVGGRSGTAAVEDNRRLCEFIYRNLSRINRISATMDTHHAAQIFHPIFLTDVEGNHPAPYTQVSPADIESGRWSFNPSLGKSLGVNPDEGNELLRHYTKELKRTGKYDLTIWPYHAILGGIGHALVSAVEEAIFFHTIARVSQPVFFLKGENAFTEHYSAVGPEILSGPSREALGKKNQELLDFLGDSDLLVIAGQAKSHCVTWTVADLLEEIQKKDPAGAGKIYLLEDCTSPVVVPDAADFTEQAEVAFARFAAAGVNIVHSTTPMADWPNR